MTGQSDPARRLTISIGLHGSLLVAHASGDLDYRCADLLHRQIGDAWQDVPTVGVVLDLGGLTFCDSMGVGALVLLLHQSRAQRSPLVLSSLPARVERILAITGLRGFFHVEPSVEAAIQAAGPGHVTGTG
ncbi:STAS domain-containing protein [Nonomuraea sp. FMUSA5-5]|uniref:Anti-sigma factor antagonist n=1 Tax=Nonomuraea composti TaxID=2720023 RepID=A0ABX1B5F3_9ACTN|nr:STAS domain-containing protein [Nonomuraea sp. FMUSA5-5]NJP91732.1 STAS domain-containing protein [Nonomuraea sp. FMUSA5-5]